MKKILFQGDSITDCNRFSEETNFLGSGYVSKIAQQLEFKEDIEIINRGISGNRVMDLKNRWTEDCININPDILTIMIGINDVWRIFDSGEKLSFEDFKNNYDFLLNEVISKTNSKIILIEPFVLPIPEDRKEWRATLDPIITIVRELAKKYKTELINLDGLFAKKSIKYGDFALAEDGVHPTQLGHGIIKDVWFETYMELS